jgi:oligosaccharide translocation protein RFT1
VFFLFHLLSLSAPSSHRLTLLYDTVLFISREALRKAGLSQTTSHTEWNHTSNLMWCCIPAGIVSSVLLGTLWVSPLINQPNVAHDLLGVIVFGTSALVELIVEPAWVLAQLNHYVTLKVI